MVTYRDRIVIPEVCRSVVLKSLHVGHSGTSAMKSKARSLVYWPKMDFDIEQVTKNCSKCFSNYEPPKTFKYKWPETENVWERVHVDWCGPIEGNYFLIIVDSKSKFLDVYDSKSLTADATIKHLRTCFSNFGLPFQIVTDNGPCFRAENFKNFVQENNVIHTFTSPYAPQSNGLAERHVGIFKRLWHNNDEGSVETRLRKVLYHYRSTVQSVTKVTPAYMMFGRNFRTELDFLKIKKYPQPPSTKFKVGEPVFAKNFGIGAQWVKGNIEVLNATNYRIQLSANDSVVWQRHQSQLFKRELVEPDERLPEAQNERPSEIQDDPISLHTYPTWNPVGHQSEDLTGRNTENPETRTRSGRVSRPPDRLNL